MQKTTTIHLFVLALSAFALLTATPVLAGKPDNKTAVCHIGSEEGPGGETYDPNCVPTLENDYFCADAGKIDLIKVLNVRKHLGKHEYGGLSDYLPGDIGASGIGQYDEDSDGIDQGCQVLCPCWGEAELAWFTTKTGVELSGACDGLASEALVLLDVANSDDGQVFELNADGECHFAQVDGESITDISNGDLNTAQVDVCYQGIAALCDGVPSYCAIDEYVANNTCTACAAGTTNEAGDDASGDDTSCDVTSCAVNEYVSGNVCTTCGLGTTNAAGDDASGGDTSCDVTTCAIDEYVSSNVCTTCGLGTTNAAGDDASGDDTSCDVTSCAVNEYVSGNVCTTCGLGTTNAAGDDASGDNTSCDATSCAVNEYVSGNVCTACEAGTTNAAGDDASGDNTSCDATSCAVNEYVSGNVCTACEAGTTNAAGDDASGDDTSCDVTSCAVNEYVSGNVCTTCGLGTTNAAGDDASGDNTSCDATSCAVNEYVSGNVCTACEAGTTNAAGDDASGDDTSCDVTSCAVNEYVSGNVCTACGPGTTNAAGDDASGDDTSCDVTTCAIDEYVSSNVCTTCGLGTTNAAGDDASGDDTSCDVTSCAVNEYVSGNVCTACGLGTTNAAGDDASGDDTSCDVTSCAVNEYVSGNVCTTCGLGTTNAAGDDASGDNTSCDVTSCAVNEYVSGNVCTACEAGTTNAAGDDASGDNTSCDATSCAVNEYVSGNVCTACEAGTTNAAGDDASGDDTSCDVTSCAVNEYVSGNVCTACGPGTTNAAGDDASGGDTSCDVTTCAIDEYVSSNVCTTCGLGTTNAAGDDASGGDTSCDVTTCAIDEYVSSNVCTACGLGTTNAAGDDASGDDTSCDVTSCAVNEYVSGNVCTTCGLGTTNAAGDDASGDNTSCDATSCAVNEYVSGNVCTACEAGTTNAAGDDASGDDTSCDVTSCAVNEYVSGNTCTACAAGTTNAAGDDPAGNDTVCDSSVPSLEFEVGPCLETQTTCEVNITGVDSDPSDTLSFFYAPVSRECVPSGSVAYFDTGAPVPTSAIQPLTTDPDNARMVRLVVNRQALGEFGSLPRKLCFAVEDSYGNGKNDLTTRIAVPLTPVDEAPTAVDWTYASAWEDQNIPTTVLFVSSQVKVTNLDNYFFNDPQGGDNVAIEIVSLPSTGSLEHEVNGNWVALSVNDRMSCACPFPCSNVDPCNSLQVRYVPGSIVQDPGFSDAFTFKVVDVDTGVTAYAAPGFQNLESAVRTVTFLVGPREDIYLFPAIQSHSWNEGDDTTSYFRVTAQFPDTGTESETWCQNFKASFLLGVLSWPELEAATVNNVAHSPGVVFDSSPDRLGDNFPPIWDPTDAEKPLVSNNIPAVKYRPPGSLSEPDASACDAANRLVSFDIAMRACNAEEIAEGCNADYAGSSSFDVIIGRRASGDDFSPDSDIFQLELDVVNDHADFALTADALTVGQPDSEAVGPASNTLYDSGNFFVHPISFATSQGMEATFFGVDLVDDELPDVTDWRVTIDGFGRAGDYNWFSYGAVDLANTSIVLDETSFPITQNFGTDVQSMVLRDSSLLEIRRALYYGIRYTAGLGQVIGQGKSGAGVQGSMLRFEVEAFYASSWNRVSVSYVFAQSGNGIEAIEAPVGEPPGG